MSTESIGETVEQCAEGIAEIVADYRSEDDAAPSPDHVSAWIQQFDSDDRLVVAQETQSILTKRYVSKEDAEKACAVVIRALAKEYSGGDIPAMLRSTAFLDLQPAGKSQGAMLEMIGGVTEHYGIPLRECGGSQPARFVYIDDVLCTGNTLYWNMREWWLAIDATGRSRQDTLPAATKIEYIFLALHQRNWEKVQWRLKFDKDLKASAMPTSSRVALRIENDVTSGAMEFVFPRRSGLPPAAEEYFTNLGTVPTGVFRPDGMPLQENLFTSPAARDRFERAVLTKGIDIIRGLGTHKQNMHPLGFTLPSQKSLGFGALVFTWRNIPNNSPLVFWHDSAKWTPLFKKRPPAPEFDVVFPF